MLLRVRFMAHEEMGSLAIQEERRPLPIGKCGVICPFNWSTRCPDICWNMTGCIWEGISGWDWHWNTHGHKHTHRHTHPTDSISLEIPEYSRVWGEISPRSHTSKWRRNPTHLGARHNALGRTRVRAAEEQSIRILDGLASGAIWLLSRWHPQGLDNL